MPTRGPANRSSRLASTYEALVARPNSTVSALMQATGLSRPTITNLLESLTELGLIAPQGAEGSLGRPAETWAPRDDAGVVIAIDLLHRSALAATARLDGEVTAVGHRSLISVDRSPRFEDLVGLITEQIQHNTDGPVHAIVVSTTGTVASDGHLMRSDAVPQWEGFELGRELAERLGMPVQVENDVNCAAYGEFALRCGDGALQPTDDLLLIAVTRTIVTGLVLSGHLHRGHNQNAGEVGIHLVEGYGPSIGGLGRLAESIGTISAVLDPATIVIALPNRDSPAVLTRISDHLRTTRESSAAELNLEYSRMGQGSAVVGALSLALHQARTVLFGQPSPHVIVPKALTQITNVTARGTHYPMSPDQATAADRATLRIGVVGVGARSDIAKHFELPGLNCRITAAAEPHPDGAARILNRLGRSDIKLTRNVTELIAEGIDAALVTSPDDTHAEVTCELLRAGIPVYVEKPLATRIADGIAILETAYETGTKLYVGHNMRHMNVVRSMRELIRTGAIGEVKAIWCRHFVGNGGDYYFKDWHATREHGTGLLLQKAAHDLDVMHWLADSHTERVTAMGGLTLYDQITDRKDRSGELLADWFSMDNWPPLTQTGLNPVIDVEDISMMLMEMSSGLFASYQQCHYTPDYWRNYTVIGTEGRIENFGDGEGGHIKLWNRRHLYSADGDAQFPIKGDAGGHSDADILTISEFVSFITQDAPTDTSPLGAWHAMAAAVAATDSLRSGSTPQIVPNLKPEVIEYFNNNQVK
ncbi:MAG: ROK family protein [Propionibacteriaceae bacterium]|nr:ROK family protein [Propionibacteriaceae bacterium]